MDLHSTAAAILAAPAAPSGTPQPRDALAAPAGGGWSEMLVLTPRSFNDARTVIEAVRANRAVLVNSAWLEDSPGQRLIDFVCGGMEATRGQAHRIAEEVFLFAPAAVRVSGPG